MYYPRWFNPGSNTAEYGLSILHLVNSGTVDCKLAGLLWVLMEHRLSALVAAGPSFAGKSTLFQAILDFLPPGLNTVILKGYYEDFKFTENSTPEKTYMVADEISNHGFLEYLWGHKAVRAFKLMSQGYGLGGTIHARNTEEVIYVLNGYLGITLPVLTELGIVVNLHARNGATYYDDPIRRVVSVDLILPDPQGLKIQVLAARKPTENGFDYLTEKDLRDTLREKRLNVKDSPDFEIDTRSRYLKHLLKSGDLSRKTLRKAVVDYYRTRTL